MQRIRKTLVLGCMGILALLMASFANHPFYVSVVRIDHDNAGSSLQVTVKVFTDDMEKALENKYGTGVNLLRPASQAQADTLIKKYFLQHFSVKCDNATAALEYLGYERDEEGINVFFEGRGISRPARMEVFDDALYESHKEQSGIIHVKVGGLEKNTQLVNPQNLAIFHF